jgi:hypothetical protein
VLVSDAVRIVAILIPDDLNALRARPALEVA